MHWRVLKRFTRCRLEWSIEGENGLAVFVNHGAKETGIGHDSGLQNYEEELIKWIMRNPF